MSDARPPSRSPAPPSSRKRSPPAHESSADHHRDSRRRERHADDDAAPWWEQDRNGPAPGAIRPPDRDRRGGGGEFAAPGYPSRGARAYDDRDRDHDRRESYAPPSGRGAYTSRGGGDGYRGRGDGFRGRGDGRGRGRGRGGSDFDDGRGVRGPGQSHYAPGGRYNGEEAEVQLNYSNQPPAAKAPPPPPPPAVEELPPIVIDTEPEPDPEQILAERRRKRLEILAKYASSANTPAQSEGGQTPNPGTPVDTGTPGRKEVERATDNLRIGSESPVGGGSSGGEVKTDDGAFDLFKDEASNEAIRIGDESRASADNKEVSAADYNPDEDRKQDDRRQAEREGGARAPAAIAPPAALATVVAQADDDDDDDDMFSIGVKPIVVDDGPPQPTFIPVINRSLDGQSGLTDNYDDDEGYYKIVLGELLDNGRYHVHANLGKGMFSGVVRAKDMESTTGLEVAIKVIRSQESMYKAGMKEANILRKLQEADPTDKKHLIRLERTFDHRGHLCLVFESLSMNLREVVKRYGKDVGINLRAVRAYASQMFLGLALMKKCEIMHADIKPDNILVNESKSVLKICDLGSASDLTENDITPYLCSRFYRAPEIILGLPYDCALDTWSIGCTLYELYTGKILFPGRTNNHMLALIMELKGKMAHKMIKKARFGEQHFDESMNFISVEKNDTTKLVAIPSRATNDLKARLMPASAMKKLKEDEVKLVAHFVDLLDKMLNLDPAKRPTPKEMLNHPFLRT